MKQSAKIALAFLILLTSCNRADKALSEGITIELDSVSPIEYSAENVVEEEQTIVPDSSYTTPFVISEEGKANIVRYVKHFQSLLINNDVEAIIAETEFPLLGDCVYYMIWGENYFDDPAKYEGKIDAKAFRKGFRKIFDNEFGEFMKDAKFTTAMLEKEVDYKSQVDSEGRYHAISITIWGEENNFELSVSRIDPVESINEHSKRYHFKKVGNSYKLFLINCAG